MALPSSSSASISRKTPGMDGSITSKELAGRHTPQEVPETGLDQDKTAHSPVQPVDLEHSMERRPPANNERSKLEKILFFLLIISVAAVVTLAVYIGIKYDELTAAPGQADARDVCTSPECVTAASNLIQNIDDTVSPCEDFYQFSCGKWKTRFKIPKGEPIYSTQNRIQNNVGTALQGLLEAPVSQGDKDYIRKVKDLYASCMDIEQINEQHSKPLKLYINELGGWPMVDENWDPNSFSLTDLMVKVSRIGGCPLMCTAIMADLNHPSKQSLYFDQTDFGLPGEQCYNMSNSDNWIAMLEYKQKIFKVANKVGKCSENDTDELIEFEIKLSEIVTKKEDRRDPNSWNNPQKLKDINNLVQIPKLGLNLTKYTVDLMALVGVDITEDEVIIIPSPNYFIKLKDLLDKTDKRIIANYVVWRIVDKSLDMLSSDFRELSTNYEPDVARDKHCFDYVNQAMGFAAGRVFLDHMFPPQARELVNEMIDNLKLAFNRNLQELNWIDNDTRAMAKIKNDNMKRKIGYPDFNTDDDYLSKLYGSEVKRDHFFQNCKNLAHGGMLDMLRKLRKPTEKSEWMSPPQTTNAFYNPLANDITFPGGILQPPLVHPKYPKYLNYGGIGTVIGHEIIHGFDDTGRKYDKNGKLENWWTNATSEKYKNKVQCLIDQYSQFSKNISGQVYHLNGVMTQGENIADNGGIKMSYQAYKSWEAQQEKPEPGLPGLPYNNDQLFFINYGQSSCSREQDRYMVESISRARRHPLRVFRVHGTAQNMPDLGKVFNCMKGSEMNPIKKCSVW